jgi:hypothetical protein
MTQHEALAIIRSYVAEGIAEFDHAFAIVQRAIVDSADEHASLISQDGWEDDGDMARRMR